MATPTSKLCSSKPKNHKTAHKLILLSPKVLLNFPKPSLMAAITSNLLWRKPKTKKI